MLPEHGSSAETFSPCEHKYVTRTASRIPIRTFPNPKVRLQYLIFPYADFSVGTLGNEGSFACGPFVIWRDTIENWQRFLNFPRPSNHLSMYVGRDGKPISTMWIGTLNESKAITQEHWQRLTAVLFYLAWARLPFLGFDRPAAEDFYAEAFVLPEGAEDDSTGHVRWSKYGSTFHSDLKLHPVPEVSFRRIQIDLPLKQTPPGPFYDPTPGELFKALEKELTRTESRTLTALWFLMDACYRSASRSSFAEDIQNICTAFEALLDVSKKGDSAKQVSDRLQLLFSNQAASPVEKAVPKKPTNERKEVLLQLSAWVGALYDVRNSYTHGKEVKEYMFGERSIWQDAFEILRLAANRAILKTLERHPPNGSMLEKRLMSVRYFDEAVSFFSKRREWMDVSKKSKSRTARLKEIVRKAKSLDPQLVEWISSVQVLRQALFNICTAILRALENVNLAKRSDRQELEGIMRAMQRAYTEAREQGGKLNTDKYIRAVAPRLAFWTPVVPFAGKTVLLYEIIQAFKALLAVYGNFTGPILNTLATMNPPVSKPNATT